jgi:hypothetical protein
MLTKALIAGAAGAATGYGIALLSAAVLVLA